MLSLALLSDDLLSLQMLFKASHSDVFCIKQTLDQQMCFRHVFDEIFNINFYEDKEM